MRPRTTAGTRIREQEKLERRQLKEERRRARKLEAGARDGSDGESDPDLAGIVPGPQPTLAAALMDGAATDRRE